jgi:hypothetical protein
MNNYPGLMGGAQRPPDMPGLLGQRPPMVPPDQMAPPPAPPDPVLEQIAALVAQQDISAPQMPPQMSRQPEAPPEPPQPEQPKEEPFNWLPHEGNRIADEYIARLQMNPAAGPMLGGIAPMPGYDPKQAFANWSAGLNQPDQPRPHPAYKGPGYGEQLRMDAARAQADESLRSASRI